MSDPTGGFELEIGGKTRTIKFGSRGIFVVDERLGEGTVIRGQVGPRAVMILIWAGLLHSEPKLALQKVMKWFDDIPDEERGEFFARATEAGMGAYQAWFGDEGEEEDVEEEVGNAQSVGENF